MNKLCAIEFVLIYDKLRNGDSISDEELENAIPYLEDKVEFLSILGDKFHFAWRDLYNDLQTLKSFRQLRKERNQYGTR
jgi:hypothetical protein